MEGFSEQFKEGGTKIRKVQAEQRAWTSVNLVKDRMVTHDSSVEGLRKD